MQDINAKIKELASELGKALKLANSPSEANDVRVKFLGKKGLITALFSTIKDLSIEDKRKFAPLLNKFKSESEQKVADRQQALVEEELKAKNLKQQSFDVSAYDVKASRGSLHPYSKTVEEFEDIFLSMGYEVLDGPEVETDYYNFTGLNIPEDHPARDMYDTFWTDLPNTLLRTHTSTIQVHAMETRELPIAAIATGRCFRHEATDASHDFMFMQLEGMLIDKNVNISNLFATAKSFLKAFFKKDDINIRIRPGFFPFVEPGVEIDMECPFCKNGCSVCSKSKWIEVFPGGMIHPNVLRASNIDPDIYSGFAFCIGLTRLAMIKYGINDIRLFHSGKIRFLEQF